MICLTSQILFHFQMIVLGTMGGAVVVLDHLGYKILHRRPHVAQVVSVDLTGDYWVSGGKDRKVSFVASLFFYSI